MYSTKRPDLHFHCGYTCSKSILVCWTPKFLRNQKQRCWILYTMIFTKTCGDRQLSATRKFIAQFSTAFQMIQVCKTLSLLFVRPGSH